MTAWPLGSRPFDMNQAMTGHGRKDSAIPVSEAANGLAPGFFRSLPTCSDAGTFKGGNGS